MKVAIPLSCVLGGPLSGWMLQHFSGGPSGLAAWQWLYLLQGVPTVLLGLVVFFALPNSVNEVRWLFDIERQLLTRALERDSAAQQEPKRERVTLSRLLESATVCKFDAIYFSIQMGVYAINFWLPSIIQSLGITNTGTIGWLSAIPYLASSIAMVLSADRRTCGGNAAGT
ncbi:MFS family permease [Paraburkholderia youngii]